MLLLVASLILKDYNVVYDEQYMMHKVVYDEQYMMHKVSLAVIKY